MDARVKPEHDVTGGSDRRRRGVRAFDQIDRGDAIAAVHVALALGDDFAVVGLEPPTPFAARLIDFEFHDAPLLRRSDGGLFDA